MAGPKKAVPSWVKATLSCWIDNDCSGDQPLVVKIYHATPCPPASPVCDCTHARLHVQRQGKTRPSVPWLPRRAAERVPGRSVSALLWWQQCARSLEPACSSSCEQHTIRSMQWQLCLAPRCQRQRFGHAIHAQTRGYHVALPLPLPLV